METILSNLIAILVVAVAVGSAIIYIWKSKKKGVKCIGCPSGKSCSGCCSNGTKK